MNPTFAAADAATIPLHVIDQGSCADWISGRPKAEAEWLGVSGFKGKIGEAVLLPDADGSPSCAVIGYGSPSSRARSRFILGAGVPKLPAGTYRIEGGLPPEVAEAEALGWLMCNHRFNRYRKRDGAAARLVAPDGVDAERIEILAAGEALTRDLINTPSSDMGPEELAEAAREIADANGATFDVTVGDALLEANFPMIHAVGRASTRAPRLIEMRKGDKGPRITLVGKGVCFDTGGLSMKSPASMGQMKKDMGGAANVLGLAQIIMQLGLPVQLRVLIPAVENSVSGSAMRPGDILTSRKGLTVEINNTDAEGRLVLADALALADEEETDLIVSMATLTGAARVAVGSDLSPFFTDDENLASALADASGHAADPVWRMPFHEPYEEKLEPGIADLDNAPKGGFAGAITAALFLRRFVKDAPAYCHFDIYAWSSSSFSARPKGGLGQGSRALLGAIKKLHGV